MKYLRKDSQIFYFQLKGRKVKASSDRQPVGWYKGGRGWEDEGAACGHNIIEHVDFYQNDVMADSDSGYTFLDEVSTVDTRQDLLNNMNFDEDHKSACRPTVLSLFLS